MMRLWLREWYIKSVRGSEKGGRGHVYEFQKTFLVYNELFMYTVYFHIEKNFSLKYDEKVYSTSWIFFGVRSV
jgi:hypothetical protein